MRKLFLLLCVTLLSLTSCNKDDSTTPVAPQGEWVSPTTINIEAGAETCTFRVDADMNDIKASADQSWCEVDVDDNGVNVACEENDKNSIRTAIITIKDTKYSRTSNVLVVQAKPTLTLPENISTVKISATGEATMIEIETNCQIEATSDAEWLSFIVDGNTLTIKATQNPDRSSRDAVVTVTAGGISSSFEVEQAGATLSISEEEMEFSALEASKSFEVKSNINWELNCEDSWVKIEEKDNVITVSVDKNEGDTRYSNIVISAGNISETCTVAQKSVYDTYLGNWKVTSDTFSFKDGYMSKDVVLTLSEKEKNKSYYVGGLGLGYFMTSDNPCFTLNINVEDLSLSYESHEYIGNYAFMNFESEDGCADVISVVYTYQDDNMDISTDYVNSSVVTGSTTDDLENITFEQKKGLAFGLRNPDTDTWTSYLCSYVYFNLTMEKIHYDEDQPSPVKSYTEQVNTFSTNN